MPREVVHTHASPRSAVGFLIHAAEIDGDKVGPRRNLTMPGVGVTVGEQIEALRRIAGDKTVALIREARDDAVAKIVSGWPTRFEAKRARDLGFAAEETFDAIIMAHIEDELGGEITFSSTVGMGTEFVVRLPASTARPRPEPKAVTTTAEGRASILIVDDDPLVGSSIGRLLRRSHEVIIANSGLAALERLDSGVEFDLVLCDLMMPDMTGMDFYGRVHELFPEVTERFVFMTGGAFTEAAARFIERTEHPVLTKPIRTATLREVVASALARRATSDEEGPSSPAA